MPASTSHLPSSTRTSSSTSSTAQSSGETSSASEPAPRPLTRRRLLAGGAAVIGLGGVAYGANRFDDGATDASFASWSPAAGTWPLRRYDPANTAHNPHAEPPRTEPSRTRRLSPPGEYYLPIVGPESLVLYGSRLHRYAPDGDGPVSSDGRTTPAAGFGPEADLYAARANENATAPSLDVVALRGDDAEASVLLDGVGETTAVDGFTVGREEVYVSVAGTRTIAATGLRGGRTWDAGGQMTALSDGRLYAAGAPDGTVAYAERSGLDRRLAVGPKRRWTAEQPPRLGHPPAVADGRVVLGTYGSLDSEGAVAATDADSGERLWTPRYLGRDVSTPAVVADRGYLTVGADDLTRGFVASLDLETGATRWRDDIEWYAFSPVAGGNDTIVVVGEDRDVEPTVGVVRAYDAPSGDVLWTVRERFAPDALALVDDRVLVGGSDGVHVFR